MFEKAATIASNYGNTKINKEQGQSLFFITGK